MGEKGAWADPGTAQIFGVLVSQDRVKLYELQIWQVRSQSQDPSEQNPIKNFGKKERGRIQGLPHFFQYPLLSQERVKLRTSNFVRTFLVSIGTKARKPVTNFGKISRGRIVRIHEIFQGTHILGASRGRLCDSSAFLYTERV